MASFRLQVLVLAVLLSGCASLSGAPEPITAEDVAKTSVCPIPADIEAYYPADADKRHGLTPDQWRDVKIAGCVAVIDRKFADFLARLRQQRITTSLGGDLALLTLTGVAAVASTGTSQALAAASTGVVGAKVAIDKDLYFEQTLPALEAAMETNRAAVLLRIRNQQSGKALYTLADAVSDIRAYEAAGSIDSAIKSLTAIAAKAEHDSADKLASVEAKVLDQATYEPTAKMVAYVNGLVTAGDLAKLQALAKAFELVVPDGATAQRIGNRLRSIIVHMADADKLDEARQKIVAVDPSAAGVITP